jgi:transcriptional regulator with GAF, ATPase, and Fis domain
VRGPFHGTRIAPRRWTRLHPRTDNLEIAVLRHSLRDIAGTLAGAPDMHRAVEAMLVYLRALQPDWHPTVAMYEPDAQVFDAVYQLDRKEVHRRAMAIPLDHLPTRLVRNYILPSAIFSGDDRRTLLERLFHQSPGYEPDGFEGQQLQPLTAPVGWRSCACLPLNDRSDLLGLIVIVSPKVKAFGPAALESLQPLRGLASLALARHLYAHGRRPPETRAAEEAGSRVRSDLEQRLRAAEEALEQTRTECESRGALLRDVLDQEKRLRADSAVAEADRLTMARKARALEEKVQTLGDHLAQACATLAEAESRLAEATDTLNVVSDALEITSNDTEPETITRTFVTWFCERFQVGRVTVMRLDAEESQLRILAHRGIDPRIAARVRVPVGQGVAGWVARHREPLLVQRSAEPAPVRATGLDQYNSESFLVLPLVHRQRVVGVLNLSNKEGGDAFDALDLQRARLASQVLASALGEAIAA